MEHTTKTQKPKGRGERHSAAWGKRLSLVLLLATGMAFGQRWNNPIAGESNGRFSSRIAPELSGLLAKAHQGSAKGQTVRVIVQYKQVPTAAHYATMQGRGGRLHSKLHMIKGAAFTIPVSALAALEADPEIASVTIDHPMNVMDDLTNDATGVDSAWNAGYNGAGVGVAVIDSGINDSHPDLQGSERELARGLSPGLHRAPRPATPAARSMTSTVTVRTWPESSLATARCRVGNTRASLPASL